MKSFDDESNTGGNRLACQSLALQLRQRRASTEEQRRVRVRVRTLKKLNAVRVVHALHDLDLRCQLLLLVARALTIRNVSALQVRDALPLFTRNYAEWVPQLLAPTLLPPYYHLAVMLRRAKLGPSWREKPTEIRSCTSP
jgi:hypothetical protein